MCDVYVHVYIHIYIYIFMRVFSTLNIKATYGLHTIHICVDFVLHTNYPHTTHSIMESCGYHKCLLPRHSRYAASVIPILHLFTIPGHFLVTKILPPCYPITIFVLLRCFVCMIDFMTHLWTHQGQRENNPTITIMLGGGGRGYDSTWEGGWVAGAGVNRHSPLYTCIYI